MAVTTLNLKPATLNVEAWQADDVLIPLVFKDSAGVPIDLTGRTFASEIRDQAGNLKSTATITVTPLTGSVLVKFPKTDTATMLPTDSMTWDLQQTMSGDVRTWVTGRFRIKIDITA